MTPARDCWLSIESRFLFKATSVSDLKSFGVDFNTKSIRIRIDSAYKYQICLLGYEVI